MATINLENVRELEPNNGRKSFYGKALVETKSNGSEVLYSYNTPIIERTAKGELIPLVAVQDVDKVMSNTTCTHLKSFCGLNKADYRKLYKGEIKREPAFVEIGRQFTELGKKLWDESLDYLQTLCKENGTINFEVLDICVSVTYDGGNHPEYASNAFSDVIDVHLDENGYVELNIEDCDEYEVERICCAELYGVAMEIYEALKNDGRTYKEIEEECMI
jgi:hypothetical protein